jgi:hypothetical protein
VIVFFTKQHDDQTKEDETRRACSMHSVTDVYIILVREPEQRRPRDMRHRRHNNIKVDLKETVEGVDWICVAQGMDQW